MKSINRALRSEKFKFSLRKLSDSVSNDEVPCIFISYQRADEEFANEIATYILSKQIDIYFDLEDNDLKLHNQAQNPKGVTEAIMKGINQAQYMLVIVSPDTYTSLWVPFEVGYAFDKKGDKIKILRHKGINTSTMPDYLKVKEMLQGIDSLNQFLYSIRKENSIYEQLARKNIQSYDHFSYNPLILHKYLDNK